MKFEPLLVLALLAFTGCEAAGDTTATPTPTPEVWVHPSFSGDGLPPSEDTDHQTTDDIESSTQSPGDDDDEEEPDLVIVDGLFAWSYSEQGGYSAALVLMAETVTCHDLFGALDNVYPDGIYYTLVPRIDESVPQWTSLYPVCGEAPCMTGYIQMMGERTNLEETATLTIESYDVHYLTSSWSSEASSGTGLKFYNCGDTGNWDY